MRTIEYTNKFKRDFRRALRDPQKDTDKLERITNQLQITGSLPREYHPHPLRGEWKPAWECHIQPDFLLIYDVTDDVVILRRCGSHSELFN